MIIGDRLKDLREAKHFSQGEIEKRTGLLRCYVSRVENGHTVPAVETLEKAETIFNACPPPASMTRPPAFRASQKRHLP